MDDDIDRQYELYRRGNIDELMTILDEPDNSSTTTTTPVHPALPPAKPSAKPPSKPSVHGQPSKSKQSMQLGTRRRKRTSARAGTGTPARRADNSDLIGGTAPALRATNSDGIRGTARKHVSGSSTGPVIDSDWMMEKISDVNVSGGGIPAQGAASSDLIGGPSGINAIDFAGPLNLPDQDYFNLNTRRRAQARAEKGGGSNQGSTFRSQRYAGKSAQSNGGESRIVTRDGTRQAEPVSRPRPVAPIKRVGPIISQKKQDEENVVNVNEMLDAGSDVLSKVRSVLASNQTIPPDGLAGIEAAEKMRHEQEGKLPPPPVPPEKIAELHAVQDHWLELDNEIKGIRSLIRELQKKKKELEDYLKNEMQKYQIPHLTPPNGSEKIVLKTGNRKGNYKKDYIFAKLQEKLGDPEMAANLAEHLEKSRPINETVTITRSKK